MSEYTKEELAAIDASMDRIKKNLTPRQKDNLGRMSEVVFVFEELLESFDKVPHPGHGVPLFPDKEKREHQEGRFVVYLESKDLPARRLLMLNGASIVDRRAWDYTDYCAAISAIPSIYLALNRYNDIAEVDLYMAEGFLQYIS